MREQKYYCDCCKKEVRKESELSFVTVSLGSNEGWMDKEVCFDCWKIYVNKMAEVYKEMFNKSR